MYSYRTVTVRTSRFGAWGLTTKTGNSRPIQKGCRSNATLFDNRQQKNSKCGELRTWKQSPLDSDHVLIQNTSLADKGVYFKGLCTQLFAKWSFVLVYHTSLIQHKSKYSVIFPYLRCNLSECETIIYYVNDRLCTSVAFQRWHRGGCADVWFTVFYFDKVPTVLSS